MEREEFTFQIPTNKNTAILSVDSKPWWCVTYSSASSEKSENKQDEVLENCFSSVSRQSSSCCGRNNFADMKGGVKEGNEEDEMENMDLLWEDFNDETICRSCGLLAEPDLSSRRMVGLGCTGAFKLVKAEGGRMPTSGVLIKLVKKLFLHNNQPSLKRST